MEIKKKLEILADAAKYDASCSSSGSQRKRTAGGLGNTEGMGICHSYTPDGRCVSLLKILLTNFCIYDCKFCINRLTSNTPRARFTPEEVAWLTYEFYKRNYIEGLFLSSGVIQDADYTMNELARAAKLLRTQYRFNGYIHLKSVPRASAEVIQEAGKWCDRLSANIELPEQTHLNQLAPGKSHDDIQKNMNLITDFMHDYRENKKQSFVPAGQSTQMIVGATPSTDKDILYKSSDLYKNQKLRRVYYSAFSPIPDSDKELPFERPPLIREHRLYQADWLMRFYGFRVQEIVDEKTPSLSLEVDPKMAWALRNRNLFPINVQTAPKETLLRIPGLGMRNVERILQIRRYKKITLADLQKIRVSLKKTQYFIETSDFNPHLKLLDSMQLPSVVKDTSVQLSLFEGQATALTGEL